MILWILKGMYTVKTDVRTHKVNQSAAVISQQILQAHESNRQQYQLKCSTAAFRSMTETPQTLGISLYCDHNWRSQKLANLLSHAGLGVPCQRVKQCITQMAKLYSLTWRNMMGSTYHQNSISNEDPVSHSIILMPRLTHQTVEIHFMQQLWLCTKERQVQRIGQSA